ncbi:MAG: SUMF1/EgtB/PvdO family nonheme iron enzyme [Bacteroidales bacterium]|nr:SUMF1/EgtB/PvdO family nonheme iron enzyme [Bacteroidales bacterium]
MFAMRFSNVKFKLCIFALICFGVFFNPLYAQFNNDYWVKVEGGTFVMGCSEKDDECYPDEQPAHRVTLNTFYIGKYEVTVRQYRDYCNKIGKQMPEEPKYGWQDNYPIVNLTWQEANEYAEYYGCRLPTEAEWEYAAKGGNKSEGYIYSGSNNWYEVGWSYENSDREPHEVGQKKPNELGIYDMSGNAWEWCSDNYEIFYYAQSPANNPKGPQKGLGKVNRGGCFAFDYALMNVHHRRCSDPNAKGRGTGFRLVKDVKKN